MTAPERVWIDPEYIDGAGTLSVLAGNICTSQEARSVPSDVEYVRADILADSRETAAAMAADNLRLTGLVERARAVVRHCADDIELGWLKVPDVEDNFNTDNSWHAVQNARAWLAAATGVAS